MSLRGKQANGLVTQQRVLRAAVAQFLEKGYTGTTTADITGAADPVFLYAVETALQLHIAELSEPLRELYVMAYTLPTTSAYLYRSTAERRTPCSSMRWKTALSLSIATAQRKARSLT